VTGESQQRKISFEMALDVSTDAPSWVTVPTKFMLMSNGRSFKIDVDPSQLAPGLYTAKVYGKDAANPSRGPLFSVPITVVKPLPVKHKFDFGTVALQPAQVLRYFLTPPAGSTWVDVTITDTRPGAGEDGSSRLVVLHAVQLLPRTLIDTPTAKFSCNASLLKSCSHARTDFRCCIQKLRKTALHYLATFTVYGNIDCGGAARNC
jgi:tripeptidyl-peptidase II